MIHIISYNTGERWAPLVVTFHPGPNQGHDIAMYFIAEHGSGNEYIVIDEPSLANSQDVNTNRCLQCKNPSDAEFCSKGCEIEWQEEVPF